MSLKFTERFWVGAADILNEREWIWMTSSKPLTYTDWRSGNPDNSYSNENCMEINYEGHWNDAECKNFKQYICEQENEYVDIIRCISSAKRNLAEVLK